MTVKRHADAAERQHMQRKANPRSSEGTETRNICENHSEENEDLYRHNVGTKRNITKLNPRFGPVPCPALFIIKKENKKNSRRGINSRVGSLTEPGETNRMIKQKAGELLYKVHNQTLNKTKPAAGRFSSCAQLSHK